MPTRKAKSPTHAARTRNELGEYLKINASLTGGSQHISTYERIGPSSPLWHERVAERTAKRAREGDTHAALTILQNFVTAIDQFSEQTWRGPIYWAYAHYIADAFEKIVRAAMRTQYWTGAKWSDAESGEAQADANLALGLKSRTSGRRKGATTYKEEALAAAYNLLLVNRCTPKQAKLYLKEHIGANTRTIEKANRAHVTYRLYAKHALDPQTSASDRTFALEILKSGAEPYAAKIKAILAARKLR